MIMGRVLATDPTASIPFRNIIINVYKVQLVLIFRIMGYLPVVTSHRSSFESASEVGKKRFVSFVETGFAALSAYKRI